MIYHLPGQAYYDITKAEECFATGQPPQAAGYARRRSSSRQTWGTQSGE